MQEDEFFSFSGFQKTKKILRISFDDEREREGERILSGCDPLA